MANYLLLMRLVQLIALVLLLVGFAARPTVATAVTDGHFLGPAMAATMLHQPQLPIVVVTTLENGVSPAETECSLVKCAALGILPSANVHMPRLTASRGSHALVSIPAFRLGYTQLRPPQVGIVLRA